ncbi:hypothetical protein EJB05_21107 [Eragrostis curvula]|uniref:Uncharacterized protein n=1 Tax=Eragrostis curvula TaxID=38414 RepID=A0A5J9V2D1_9POAL|nr:hypothetical protein EJB05_21107 [Eragrostis curvula]
MDPKADAQAQPPATVVPMNSAYYQQAPPAFAVQAPAPFTAWSTGLFDCFDDFGSCIMTSVCPCVTLGQMAEFLDRGSPSCFCHGAMYTLFMFVTVTGIQCIYSCSYRAKMRQQFGLQETPCPDLFVHLFCEPCSLCQMYRELTNRGFDMNQGWQANMERQGLAVPPPMHTGMTR